MEKEYPYLVTKGLTKKQREGQILERIRFSKDQIKQYEKEHTKLKDEILDDCYIGQDPWIDYFERYYIAEYNAFTKPFILTKRIKEYREGKKIIYDYQVVYKTAKGRNAPSPLRAYLEQINKKIDDAFVHSPFDTHLKKHLAYKLYKKHTDDLRAYVNAHKREATK